MFTEYKRIFRFIKPHTGLLWLAIFFMFMCSLMGGVSLSMIIPFVDKIISGKQIAFSDKVSLPPFLDTAVAKVNSIDSLTLLNIMVGTLITLFLIRQVFEYLKAYYMNELGYRFLKDIRNDFNRKILSQSLDFFYKNPTGKLMSKALFDTAIIKDSMIEGLTDLIYQPIELMIYLCMIVFVKIYFAIPVFLVAVSLGLTLLIVYPIIRLGRRIRKMTLQTQEKVADINSGVFEAITGISIVNAFSAQKYEFDKLKDRNQQYHRAAMRSAKRMLIVSPMTELIALICIGIVLWVGGRSVILKGLSAGAFIAFLAALLSLLKPFKRLSRVHTINQQALAAASRLFDVLDARPSVEEKPDAATLPGFSRDISYENVGFYYEDDKQVLKGINISIKKGEIVAFVGPSGVGKTTLLNLLPRFYDPKEGLIRIDGINTKDVTLKSLRDNIGIVTQDSILFNDTVAQNIAYGQSAKDSMENIIKAAKASNSHNFIMDMPKGYDTVIGERGFRLSGGEKQRLCIARAIFKNPPILILDEATSQLDTESELLVQEAIDRLMSGRTVLAIAHRLSTVKHAAKIYVLEGGKVVESGSHDALMAKSGLYSKLYNLQFRL